MRFPKLKVWKDSAGFTILELMIVLVIIATIAAQYIPKLVAQKQEQAVAKEVATNAVALVDAAKNYYVSQPLGSKHWPASIQILKNDNYISNAWTPTHAFGGTYALAPDAGDNMILTITAIPPDVHNIVRMSLPQYTYNESTRTCTAQIPIPGRESSLLNLPYVDEVGDSMTGSLTMKPNAAGEQSNIVVNNGVMDTLILGKQNGWYGLFGGPGQDVHVATSGNAGKIELGADGIQQRNSAGNLVMETDESGRLKAKDITLADQGGQVTLANNNIWVANIGLYGNGDPVVISNPLPGVVYNAYPMITKAEVSYTNPSTGNLESLPIHKIHVRLIPVTPYNGGYSSWTVEVFTVADDPYSPGNATEYLNFSNSVVTVIVTAKLQSA